MKFTNARTRRIIRKAFLLIWFVFSLFIAGALLYASWQHNPQSEFHESGIIHWGQWLPIGVGSFIVSGGPVPLMLFLKSIFIKAKQ